MPDEPLYDVIISRIFDDHYREGVTQFEFNRDELAAAQAEQKEAGSDLAAWKRAQSKIDFATAKLKVVGVTN